MGKIDVGGRLKSYATGHVDTIIGEYDDQRGKWQRYLDLAADAQTNALAHVQKVLKDIKEEQAAANHLMFMAFSLIGIAGSSWIGAIVMTKVYPRFAGNPHFQEFMTFSGWRIKRELEYSETLAHTVGLATHEVTGHIFDKLFEHIWPEEDQESSKKRDGALLALTSNIDTGGVGSFKTLLDSALSLASDAVKGQLNALKTNINTYRSPAGGGLGDDLARAAEKRFPRPRHIKDEDYDFQLERYGQDMLDEYFYGLRQKYAQDRKWLYYTNDPSSLHLKFLQFQLEIETWALWILNQKWKFEAHFAGVGPSGDAHASYYWETDDGFDLDAIMKALTDLAGEELRNNLKLQPKKSPTGPKNPTGWVQEIDPEADQDEGSARELSAAAKRVNEEKDLDKLLAWAKAFPGKRLQGTLDYRPRQLIPLKPATTYPL